MHNQTAIQQAKPARAQFGAPTRLACALALMGVVSAPAYAAISDDVVKIGVLTDMAGTYADFTGQGSVIAAQMAVKDFSADGTVLGKKIEIVSADHQNKADIGAERARSWIDRDKVDVITELVTTNVALSVMDVVAQKNKIALVSGAASLPITNERCNANTVHWVYDSYGLAAGTAKAMVNAGKNYARPSIMQGSVVDTVCA